MTQKEKETVRKLLENFSCYHCHSPIVNSSWLFLDGCFYHEKCEKKCLLPDHLILCEDILSFVKNSQGGKAILNKFYKQVIEMMKNKKLI